jgi:hypothetical protein
MELWDEENELALGNIPPTIGVLVVSVTAVGGGSCLSNSFPSSRVNLSIVAVADVCCCCSFVAVDL